MRIRTLGGAALTAPVLATTGATTTTADASSSGVLRIGTVNYIDSLNPFNYIEAQSTNAMIMIYPQLIQYGPGMKFQGDWADSWTTSADGKDWTFKLKPDTKWSDGQPLTAADAAWTVNTTVKYATGQVAAAALAHVKRRGTGDDARDLRVTIGNVLAQLGAFFVLPSMSGARRSAPTARAEDVSP
jgi:peptide/nickel transport system substrate-binding protein